jgi:hypothetical protein
MTSYDRPHLTMQQRYMELLALAEEHNAAIVHISAVDWHIMQQCTPSSALTKETDGRSILVYGRRFRLKPPSKAPHGTLDLTGPEPSFEA